MEPVRRRMPVNLFAGYMPALYESRRTLAEAWLGAAADAPDAPALNLPLPADATQTESTPAAARTA